MTTTFDVRNRLAGLTIKIVTPDEEAEALVHRFENKLHDLKRLIATLTGLAMGTEEYEQFDFTALEKEVILDRRALGLFIEVLELLEEIKSKTYSQRIQVSTE